MITYCHAAQHKPPASPLPYSSFPGCYEHRAHSCAYLFPVLSPGLLIDDDLTRCYTLIIQPVFDIRKKLSGDNHIGILSS